MFFLKILTPNSSETELSRIFDIWTQRQQGAKIIEEVIWHDFAQD